MELDKFDKRLTATEEVIGVLLVADCTADKRITALEERFERSLPSFEDMKGILKEKPACATCAHALSLDQYDDILCLRASVWQHPRFESVDSTDCEHHCERVK